MDKIINLVAFCLPIGIFVYWGILGYATLNILRTQRNTLQNLLLSPSVGLAVTLLPVFWLNQLGFPVRVFAIPLTLTLLAISIITLLIRRPIIPFKKYKLFAAIFLLALFLTGRPLLFFGFNWISYANDDMANYCLGALRFLNHGYFDIPSAKELINGKDSSQYYWFTFIPGMVRSGSELVLAYISKLTSLSPLQIFMPVILSFHLILISSAGAMILSSKKWYKIALVGCLFLAFSALNTLATLYQLIGQVFGLGLFITTSVLLLDTTKTTLRHSIFKSSLLIGIITSALLISYPEVFNLLIVAFIVYLLLTLKNGWKPTKFFFKTLFLSALATLIFLNKYWINIIGLILIQSSAGLTHQKGTLFPYFLIPSGLPDLWGLQTFAVLPNEPWRSISIMLGIILCAITLVLLIKQAPKRYLASIILLVQVCVSALLLILLKEQCGFILFKFAMYAQPFLFSVLAIGIFELIPTKKLKVYSIIAIVFFAAHTQYNYLQASYGALGKPFSELPNASYSHLPTELANLAKESAKKSVIISDSTNLVSAKLQSLYFTDTTTLFYSNYIFDNTVFTGQNLFKAIYPESYAVAFNLKNAILKSKERICFSQQTPSCFYKNKIQSIAPENIALIMDSPHRGIFNRFHFSEADNRNYVIKPLTNVSNHLIFINSSLGQAYYLGNAEHISLNNIEKDYFYPKNTISGVGKYLLFQIINPTKKSYLVLNLTSSLNHDGANLLPQPIIIGDKKYQLKFTGRGSARLFSSEFHPRIINNESYFIIDMNKRNRPFATRYKGLMRLYGNNLSLDNRILSGFARDISLISEEEYLNLKAPNFIDKFPDALGNKNLEYSGIYEDGWLSEDVFLKLSQPKDQTKLIIAVTLPTFQKQIDSNTLSIYVDDKKLMETTVHTGSFQFAINVPHGNQKRAIRIHSSNHFSLPTGDDRPVAAKIDFIGFKNV